MSRSNVVRMQRTFAVICSINVCAIAYADEQRAGEFTPLFSRNELPEGWVVRRWDDVSQPAEGDARWSVENGVLHGSEPRGTWLISEL